MGRTEGAVMKIYLSGSLAYDRIMDFPGRFSDHILPEKIHILNVCFTVNGMLEKFGGTAGNIAYSLSLLGEMPMILATIGKDHAPYLERLRERRIPTEGIKIIDDEFTAGAYITTDRADNQITGFNPGAMKYPSGFAFSSSDCGTSIVLIGPGNLQDMREYAKQCREIGIRYICDPGQSLTAWEGPALREWIEGSYVLVTNDYELELVMKMTGLAREELLQRTAVIVTTLGEHGSVILTRDGQTTVPAAKIESLVDPTGAGDAYRAGFLKGLVLGRELETAAKMGAVAAAYAVEKYGTQDHTYTYTEFLERYRANFGAL
jgi:adenosine kinase